MSTIKIYEGYQGIQKCCLCARSSVWWPGMSQQINDLVHHALCVWNTQPNDKSQWSHETSWPPTAESGVSLKGADRLIVVDYFLRYPEIIKLKSTTSGCIVEALKPIFFWYGVPETLLSDNYAFHKFVEFTKSYDFCHVTNSPYFPPSNGQAERTVQTVKQLLKESSDPYMALLTYQAVPLPWCDLTPAELLMGRQLRTNLPLLKCSWGQTGHTWRSLMNAVMNTRLSRSKTTICHQTHPLPPITDGSWILGYIWQSAHSRMSYHTCQYSLFTPSRDTSWQGQI